MNETIYLSCSCGVNKVYTGDKPETARMEYEISHGSHGVIKVERNRLWDRIKNWWRELSKVIENRTVSD